MVGGDVDGLVELQHDVGRRAGGREDGEVRDQLIVFQAQGFVDRGQFWNGLGALGRGHGQAANFAGLDLGQHHGKVGGEQVHLPAHQVGHGRRTALVGHVGHLHLGHAGQHFGGHQLRGAGAGKGDLVGFGFGQVDQFFQGFGREVVVDGHDQGHRAQVAHGREGCVLVIGQFLHQAFQGRVGAVGANHQGVAIRGRLGHGICAQHAVHARLVFHDDLLLQHFRHLGRESAPDLVGGTARGKGHDGFDRLVRIGLGVTERAQKAQAHGQAKVCNGAHGVSGGFVRIKA